jgi:hypothetical protein
MLLLLMVAVCVCIAMIRGGNFQISVKILNQVIYFSHYKLEIFLSPPAIRPSSNNPFAAAEFETFSRKR